MLSSEATRLIPSSDLTSDIRCNSDSPHWVLGMPTTAVAIAQRSNTTNFRLVEDSATGWRSFLDVVGHSSRRDVSLRWAPRYDTYRCHRPRGLRARARCTTSGRKPATAHPKDGHLTGVPVLLYSPQLTPRCPGGQNFPGCPSPTPRRRKSGLDPAMRISA